MYTHEQYDRLIKSTVEQINKLSTLKGGEYAGDTDRLANFRTNGKAWNLPMEQVWGVYAGKHWDAIQQYVKDLVSGKKRDRMESITSRADDLIVYLILFKAMYEERETANRNEAWVEERMKPGPIAPEPRIPTREKMQNYLDEIGTQEKKSTLMEKRPDKISTHANGDRCWHRSVCYDTDGRPI